jgi:hypothetical protein
MQAKIFLLCATLALAMASCNLYQGLGGASSDEDYREKAVQCLHQGDYVCASDNFSKLSDPIEKAKELCSVNLSRSGFTLDLLLTTMKSGNSSVLGGLANGVVPYSSDKETISQEAITQCATYSTLSPESAGAALLTTLSRFGACSLRMAKARDCACTAASQTECVARVGTKVIPATISTSGDGSISAGNPGMCKDDVFYCRDNINAVDSAALEEAGLDDIKNAVDQIPQDLKAIGGDEITSNVVRSAIAGTVNP